MTNRTLEQRIKFDAGLTIGSHLVTFTHGSRSRLAMVSISGRGVVRYLVKPKPDAMYSTWDRVSGDVSISDGPVMVWAARTNSELMAHFDGASVANIPLD